MDICFEALVGFVCAHGDAFEFLELTEEVFDQMTPICEFRRRYRAVLSRVDAEAELALDAPCVIALRSAIPP